MTHVDIAPETAALGDDLSAAAKTPQHPIATEIAEIDSGLIKNLAYRRELLARAYPDPELLREITDRAAARYGAVFGDAGAVIAHALEATLTGHDLAGQPGLRTMHVWDVTVVVGGCRDPFSVRVLGRTRGAAATAAVATLDPDRQRAVRTTQAHRVEDDDTAREQAVYAVRVVLSRPLTAAEHTDLGMVLTTASSPGPGHWSADGLTWTAYTYAADAATAIESVRNAVLQAAHSARPLRLTFPHVSQFV